MRNVRTSGSNLLIAALALAILVPLLAPPDALAQCSRSSAARTSTDGCAKTCAKYKSQTVCPIMGGKVDKSIYVDTAGYRFYACCPPCLDKIKADPTAALATLKEKGERPELRLKVCSDCGEITGTKKCCAPDAAKCGKCSLNKGSIGCCKNLKPAEGSKEILLCAGCGEINGTAKCCSKEAKSCNGCTKSKSASSCGKGHKHCTTSKNIALCANCGEAKGSAKCCSKGAETCTKCNLHKGSPGCCKIAAALADAKDVVLCHGCGEVKGNDKCCKPNTKKCTKCSLAKGSPGCCKISEFTG